MLGHSSIIRARRHLVFLFGESHGRNSELFRNRSHSENHRNQRGLVIAI